MNPPPPPLAPLRMLPGSFGAPLDQMPQHSFRFEADWHASKSFKLVPASSPPIKTQVGDCQSYGPFLDPYYNAAHNI